MPKKKEETSAGFPQFELGHANVQRFLDACLQTRVPPLLFTGAEGVGKEHGAVDFARRICCEQDPKCALAGPLCESCRNALALEHTGIHLVYPTPTQGSGEKPGDDEPDIGKILAEKRLDFFSTFTFSKKVSIRIARARATIQRANTKPFSSVCDVFVIVDAHTMREEAQNALLKVVEEPPAHSVLIFITSNPDAILYTIRSRCQRVRFGPLTPDTIERVLTNYYSVPAGRAAQVSMLAQGSIRRARELVADEDSDSRRRAFEILDGIPGARDSWLVQSALSISRGGNRDGVARFLHEFATACRDVMAGDEALFINRDQEALLTRQLDKWDRSKLPAVVDRIVDTRDSVLRRNLNTDAALVHLFLDIGNMG